MWKTILQIALAIATFVIGRISASKDRKQRWLELVGEIQKDLGGSAKMRKEDMAQDADLEDEWEKRHAEDPEIALMERNNPGMKFVRKEDGTIKPANR